MNEGHWVGQRRGGGGEGCFRWKEGQIPGPIVHKSACWVVKTASSNMAGNGARWGDGARGSWEDLIADSDV